MKKKFASVGLALVLTMTSFTGVLAASNPAVVEESNLKLETEDYPSLRKDIKTKIEIPVIKGLSDSKFQEEKNDIIKNNIVKSYEEFEKEAKAGSEFIVTYEKEVYNNVLSIMVDEYKIKAGDANGENTRTIYNIDYKSNSDLKLGDFFPYGSAYLEVLTEEVEKQIKKDDQGFIEGAFKGVTDKDSFYINKDGNLVLFYNQGSIAAYSEGNKEFIIDKDVFKSILDNEILHGDEYVNLDYNFKFRIPKNWEDKVRVRRIVDKKDVDFAFEYLPENPELESKEFFRIKVRDLSYKPGENEFEIARGDYSYIMDVFRDNPYEEGSKEREEVKLIDEALNGVEELFIPIVENEVELKATDKIILNSKEVKLENHMYENEELMLPLRQIVEELGLKVEWDAKERRAILIKDSMELASVKVGSKENSFLKSIVNLEYESELKDTKTYVPESFFIEILKADLEIDSNGLLNIKY